VRRIRADAAWVALIPVGLLSYMAFAAVRIGNPLAPFDAQDYWEHRLDWPWTGVLRVARYVAGNMGPDFTLFPVVDLALVTLMAVLLVAAVYGPYRLRGDQWPLVVFGVGALWFAISFPMPDIDPIKSASRYMLEVFAGFMVLGRIGAARWFDRVYVALALPLQTLPSRCPCRRCCSSSTCTPAGSPDGPGPPRDPARPDYRYCPVLLTVSMARPDSVPLPPETSVRM